jgi:hypothetical protein
VTRILPLLDRFGFQIVAYLVLQPFGDFLLAVTYGFGQPLLQFAQPLRHQFARAAFFARVALWTPICRPWPVFLLAWRQLPFDSLPRLPSRALLALRLAGRPLPLRFVGAEQAVTGKQTNKGQYQNEF